MKRPLRLVVIGGVAAGTRAASKARRINASMDITIVTDEKHISYAGCGLPYYFGGVIKNRNHLFARTVETFRKMNNISVLLNHRAMRINTYDHAVRIRNLVDGSERELPFDRLLIATGASPLIPDLTGADLDGVKSVHSIPDTDSICRRLDSGKVHQACVLGGGYIGMEAAENLARRGAEVTVFEMKNTPLPRMLDPDMGTLVGKHLSQKSVTFIAGQKIEAFENDGSGGISTVVAATRHYPCQLAILAAGVTPNVSLARDTRITLGPTGAIKTDIHMETSVRGIYAAGDCAETTHIVSGKPCWIPLGSTANRMGRVAGSNIAGLKKIFPGVLGTSIVKVFDLDVGRTGLSENEAKEAGFNPVSTTVETPTQAEYYPGGNTVTLKLTADKGSRKIIGAQAIGQGSVDKIIDTVAALLLGKCTVDNLPSFDSAYSPPYATALGTVNVAGQVLEEII